jgi:hypothetical protein
MPLKQPPVQNKMTNDRGLASQVWNLWFGSVVRLLAVVRDDKSFAPVTLADADAANNSIYYSSTQSKLVYKDSGGTVNDLY